MLLGSSHFLNRSGLLNAPSVEPQNILRSLNGKCCRNINGIFETPALGTVGHGQSSIRPCWKYRCELKGDILASWVTGGMNIFDATRSIKKTKLGAFQFGKRRIFGTQASP